ncbi:hypothetical protein AB0I22_21575 [Streptomyces sp. NPDC050610]|uniref:hypothetical protein n=1 Tax=Streptomyces sp. NPDC050610 TaxID=3157097 RepID=UPI003432D85E
MITRTSRGRRAASTLLTVAVVGVALAASPVNAAAPPVWETLPQPVKNAAAAILPFDGQNSVVTTRQGECGDCDFDQRLWQRNGTAWTELKLPAKGVADTVTGTSPDDLWAIGRHDGGDGTTWQVNHYDGAKWSANLSPDAKSVEILAAKAVSRTSLWGVGDTRVDTAIVPTVNHWDGETWKTTKFDDVEGYLGALQVKSENDIWAVGATDAGGVANDNHQGLVMHYDGTKWTRIPVPSIPKVSTYLDSVISNGPNDVWVSGTVRDERGLGDKRTGAYVIHWDGKSWTHRDVPGKEAVTAKSFANYDGKLYAGLSGNQKLVRWTGSAWEQVDGLEPYMFGVHELTTAKDGSLYLTGARGTFFGSIYYQQRLAAPAAR